jgi:hypothetical protein
VPREAFRSVTNPRFPTLVDSRRTTTAAFLRILSVVYQFGSDPVESKALLLPAVRDNPDYHAGIDAVQLAIKGHLV